MKIFHSLGALVLVAGMIVPALPALAAGVVVKVNGQAISDVQVSQRAALKALEHSGGAKQATDELINETLETQEAARLGITVTEGEIDDALLSVARSLKMSQSNLEKVLTDNGVAVQTLRDRLKATLSWNKVSGAVIQAKVQLSEADIDAQAKAKLNATNSYDYILKEVLFILPASGGSPSKRTAEANAYRKAFTGCKDAVQLSQSYTDAAVRDLGRRNANQFPDAIAQELAKLNAGGITKPRVVQGGVSMLAICSKEATQDTTFIANQLRQNVGDQAVKTAADKYLADLKAKAQIVYG
jgi:peptidyl-prolyl cis-trans isomerase SurA